MSYSTIDKEAQPLVTEEPSYSKKILAGAVAIAFVLGAAAATATSAASPSTVTYFGSKNNGGAKNKWDGGVKRTYDFAKYTSDLNFADCTDMCDKSVIKGGKGTNAETQMPCITSYDMNQQMVGDMRKDGSTDGATAWISFKEGEWQCQHKSYNGKFYYDYEHFDPKTNQKEGCGVVMLNDFTTTEDSGSDKETDNHWHTKPCDSKRECVCQGSRKPEWA